MRNYDDFTIADFVKDDFFLEWVRHPTAEAEEFWEQWLKLHPDQKTELLQARRLVLAFDFRKTPATDIPSEILLNRIRTSIRNNVVVTSSAPAGASRPWLGFAAVLAFLLIVGAGLSFYIVTRSQSYVVVQTAYDEKKELILPDRSVVLLNANSSLRYRSDWNVETPREVWLRGEAFFRVVKSDSPEGLKFRVHTENLDVEVLGTTFNVMNRRGKTQVVLNTGKIRLTSESVHDKAITMEPGELAELSQGQEAFVTREVNPKLYTSWTANQLVFQQSTLAEIMQILENNYGLPVKNTVNGLENRTFTGTIPTVDLDTVLYVLSEAYAVDFRKVDSAIVISDTRGGQIR